MQYYESKNKDSIFVLIKHDKEIHKHIRFHLLGKFGTLSHYYFLLLQINNITIIYNQSLSKIFFFLRTKEN